MLADNHTTHSPPRTEEEKKGNNTIAEKCTNQIHNQLWWWSKDSNQNTMGQRCNRLQAWSCILFPGDLVCAFFKKKKKHLKHPQRISISSNYFFKEVSCKLNTRLLKTGNIKVLHKYIYIYIYIFFLSLQLLLKNRLTSPQIAHEHSLSESRSDRVS